MKEIPEFILNKEYDYYYLLISTDVVFNVEFSDRLNRFISILNSQYAELKLVIPLSDKLEEIQIKNFQIPSIEVKSLYNFCEIDVALDDKDYLPAFCFDFYLSDQTQDWEIYFSERYELGICGCNENINELFASIFKPYEEETLSEKYSIITNQFRYENDKLEFIRLLKKNYNFENA